VCHIRFRPGEGGLNLNMPPETIDRLVARGTAAGALVRSRFSFGQHRLVRYLTLMQMMQRNLRQAIAQFPQLRPDVNEGAFADAGYADGHDAAWCAGAVTATGTLVDAPASWQADF